MSVYTGDEGLVKAGENPVAEVTQFSLQGSVTMHDKTAMGATGKQHKPGKIQDWSGSLTYRHDPEDPGQSEISLGAELTLELYPQGDTEGNEMITAAVVVSNHPIDVAMDSLTEKQINFNVQGRPDFGEVVAS